MEIKTNTMTQGEVLSSFAPIETFLEICDNRQFIKDGYMSNADINILMPFVTKAQEAADKVSRFALDNVNSKDKKTREIINLIILNYSNLQHYLYIDYLKGYDSTIDMLNNNIKSVVNQIHNTLDFLNFLKEEPDSPKSDEKNNSTTDEKKSKTTTALEQRNRELEEENKKLKQQIEELTKNNNTNETSSEKEEIDALKEEIETLKMEIKNKDSQISGATISSKDAAILTITACYYGGRWKNRKNLYPILTNLFHIGEALAIRRLGERIKQEDADNVAKCFDQTSPKIANIIRNMPDVLKQIKN